MRNLLYYVLFTCRLFAFGDDPFFYDKTLKKATYDCISDCIRALYNPLNLLTIDKTAVSLEKPVVFLVFDPFYKIFKIGNSKGDNYCEVFMYEDEKNDFIEKYFNLFVFWAISNIKNIIVEEDVHIYYTIQKHYFYNAFLNGEVNKMAKIIREQLQRNLPSSCIDIKYHPEEFETFVNTKYYAHKILFKAYFISLEHDNYIFKVFFNIFFFGTIKKKLKTIFNNHQDKQIEIFTKKYLNKSLKEASEQERNDLFFLSILDMLRDSIVDNEISVFQEKLLIKIMKYLTNKKAYQLYFSDFFDKNSKSSSCLEKVEQAIEDFETEKEHLLKEDGLDCVKNIISMSEKIFIYLNKMNDESFGSGKFIFEILKFISCDSDTLSKILLSEDIKPNYSRFPPPLRETIVKYFTDYCEIWVDNYIKYTQGEKEGLTPSDLDVFETLKNSCIDFALKNNSEECTVSNYMVEMADLYYKGSSIHCKPDIKRAENPLITV
ncbi:hypothetical protein NGRA_1363 [Nosema granulosis]|uniref:Uncharacterized protein n=1 Tax=Nosema granulosis TaxID=83296 RepID=A0A9P6KZ67_9MICR|nr:hypothetical protein NGRA_1363 [Nosema granulosis]